MKIDCITSFCYWIEISRRSCIHESKATLIKRLKQLVYVSISTLYNVEPSIETQVILEEVNQIIKTNPPHKIQIHTNSTNC